MKKYNFYGWENANIKDSHGLTPRDYYDLLSDIWCADTCAPRMRADWSENNKTLGQCSITSFLIQDLYGGKVYGVALEDGSYHCFNGVGDCVFDLTSEQFGDVRLDYADCPQQFREVHFASEEKRQRYELLRERLLSKLERKVTIREMSIDDIEEIKKLFREAFTTDPWNEDWSDDKQLDEYMRDIMEVRHPLILGLYKEEKLIGFSVGNIRHWCSGTEYFIEELCISRDHQGQGYGREFFSLIENKLKEKGLNQIYLTTDRDTPAYRFYKKMGFREIPEITSFFKEF